MATVAAKEDEIGVDFLVIGAGMAGMTAAASAAQTGATVMVVEKSRDVGGSAVLSAGVVWTAADFDTLHSVDPRGNEERGRLLVEGFEAGIDFVRGLGVTVEDRTTVDALMGFPTVSNRIDILRYIERCRAVVESHDGWVVTGTQTKRLLVGEGGAVVGAEVEDRDGGTIIRARTTILATGGFQADPVLRERLIGPWAVDLRLRSNPHSSGDGLRLAEAVGADISPWTGGFYGQLMADPLDHPLRPGDYVRLSQTYCPRAVLVDATGGRFIDESIGYYKNASAVAELPTGRALLIGDGQLRGESRTLAGKNAESASIDRVVEAARSAARVAEADTLTELDDLVGKWGFAGVGETVDQFNQAMAGTEVDAGGGTARRNHRRPLVPPYFAIQVAPAITFPFRGIAVAPECSVLDSNGRPITGLLAAGADAGGLYYEKYAGGLSMALVFGRIAASSALS
jgi:succinate dehydrogenase/fumarate reductase flavoprotein subunit